MCLPVLPYCNVSTDRYLHHKGIQAQWYYYVYIYYYLSRPPMSLLQLVLLNANHPESRDVVKEVNVAREAGSSLITLSRSFFGFLSQYAFLM